MALSWGSQKSRNGRLSIFAILVLIRVPFPNSNAAQIGSRPERSNLTISYPQASGALTPLWVAYEDGLFKKYGLDPSLKLLNAQVAAQALVAGEVEMVFVGPDLISARLQGAPVKYVGGMLQRFVFQLWGAKGINSLAELKGKTVAVTTPRTSTEIATRETLKKTGVISDKDVSFIYMQTIPAILTSVLTGKTSAGTLSAPNTLKARDAGLNLLADIAKLNIPGLHVAYGTSERFLKSNPNSVYALLKAVAEATVASRQNPSLAKKAIAKYGGIDDPKMIEDTYEQFAPYWDTGFAIKSESVQAQLSYLEEKDFPRVKDARPTDFFENSFVENLKRSGFLQSLGLPN